MRKVKFSELLPKTIDVKLALKVLRENGLIEIRKAEGKEGFVVLDDEGKALSGEEVLGLVRDLLLGDLIMDFCEKNTSKGDVAKIDEKNQELIIYEHDKDKEIIEEIKTSENNSAKYVC